MRHIVVLTATAVLAAAFAATASADRVYHTQRLLLSGVGGAPGWGTVINIHASGPRVYAHEVYTLHHAVPGTYQVSLQIFPTTQDCTGPSLVIPSATFTTNAIGNGHGGVKFTPEDAAGLRNSTVSVIWTFNGPATYASACAVVTLD